ncbi:MAG: hypothetical protein QM820_19115 [Minicystis sp.]
MLALDAGAHARLLLEALARPRVLHELRVHQLQRALAAGAELLDDVDRAHAALVEGANDLEVAGEDGVVGERDAHGWGMLAQDAPENEQAA